jgi:hypothetical protein
MTTRIDSTSIVPGKTVIGVRGLGVLGAVVPSTGDNGPSVLWNDIALPADNNVEVRAAIQSFPSAGVFAMDETGAFSFTGAPNGSYTATYYYMRAGVQTGPLNTIYLSVGPMSVQESLTAFDSQTASIVGGSSNRPPPEMLGMSSLRPLGF